MAIRCALGLALWSLAFISTASAHGPIEDRDREVRRSELFDPQRALSISQQAVGRQVGAHRFLTNNGQVFELSSTRGVPLVINFVYTSCDDSCPLTVQRLARAVDVAQSALGVESFSVLTIGFDTRNDTPQRMRDFARAQGINFRNWRFLSADAATIAVLTAQLGFLYAPRAGGFDHLSQITLVDAEGRVSSQIYGDAFPPQAIVDRLKDLLLGRPNLTTLSGLVERVKLVCTIYDPSSGRYRFSYAILVEFVVGGLCLAAFGVFLVRLWLQARRSGSSALLSRDRRPS